MNRRTGAGGNLVPVPVPLPGADEVDLRPPGAAEVDALSRGMAGVVAPHGELTELQRVLLGAALHAMTGFEPDLTSVPLGVEEFALAMLRRDLAFRSRIVQLTILLALVLRPLPSEVIDRVTRLAQEVGVDEGMLTVAGEFAEGSLGLAAIDFERNGYTASLGPEQVRSLHVSTGLHEAWEVVPADPALAERWRALEHLPEGTLGRRVADFYRARGFTYPGLPGSAPPLLAQHDWVHVVADFGTTVESELEVFAFIARANDDPRAFSLLAMVVSLFETGYLRTGAGLFEYDSGHLSRAGVACRVADAMRRGALCTGSIDFMTVDWFALADRTLEEVRSGFGVPAKSSDAVASGSVGPWEPGGISPFQLAAGRALAESGGALYDSFGATV